MITTTQEAKTDIPHKTLLSLLNLAGKYITATRKQTTNATSEFNSLDRNCRHYDIDTNFFLAEAVDYFKRQPKSKYLTY